jgi:predicted MFS family arabinose efflux permease
MTWAYVPSVKQSSTNVAANVTYVKSFRNIISNRSAVSCLAGTVFRFAVFAALLFYGTAFTIERFKLSIDFASIVILLAALFYTLGSLACGQFVRKIGRKSSTVIAVLLAGFFTISYAYAPSILLSVALMPEFRGTMMSLSYAFVGIGSTIGAAIGGFMLIFYDYEELGIVFGKHGNHSSDHLPVPNY